MIGGPILFESFSKDSDTDPYNTSSFSNTDLDYQLRQHDITHVVLAGLTTNTCVESTARAARELCVFFACSVFMLGTLLIILPN